MFSREKVKSEFTQNMRAMFSPQALAIWAGAFFLSVLAGPFGTFKDLELGPRALFWGIVVTASVFVGYLSRTLAAIVAGHERPVLFDAVAIAAMTVLLSPTVWSVGRLFEPVFVFKMASFPEVFLLILAVALVIFTVRRVLPGVTTAPFRFNAAEDGSFPAATLPTEPRLVRRLSAENRGEILRLSAQDHHVEIATSLGTQTLRMRLADAIGEMEPIRGFSVHRSHWVTRAAIVRVERENAQRTWLVLSNDDRVPVSRKYRADLEEAGLL